MIGMNAESTVAAEFPETLQGIIKYFADDEHTFEYMKRVRWPDGIVTCFHCGSNRNSLSQADAMPAWNPGDEFEATRKKALAEANAQR